MAEITSGSASGLPSPADFATAPTADDHARWTEADRAARPARLARLRARFQEHDVEAYFGVRRENTRYITGFVLGEGEEKVAGHSGQFIVGGEDVVVLADSRYTIQAGREASGARVDPSPAPSSTTKPHRPAVTSVRRDSAWCTSDAESTMTCCRMPPSRASTARS